MRNWQLKYRSGRLQFDQGFIRIQIAGFYFVYSQMFYHDGLPYQVSHQLFVNSVKFMESTSAVISEDRKYNTNYNGGVVFLNSTDTVSIQTPFSNHYFMNPSSSYFGAFLLHAAVPWPTDNVFAVQTATIPSCLGSVNTLIGNIYIFLKFSVTRNVESLKKLSTFSWSRLSVVFANFDWSFCNLSARYRTYT